ncbi:hypothetical protein VNO77_22583 [Canavalia gladiata]|uniref:Uncharacterized protein n=1 Tax=Canavalia gladiata TaxID=3824 RepID=A0AAN9QAP9_CANGL
MRSCAGASCVGFVNAFGLYCLSLLVGSLFCFNNPRSSPSAPALALFLSKQQLQQQQPTQPGSPDSRSFRRRHVRVTWRGVSDHWF